MKLVHRVVGRRIADQRKLMGLSQAKLAERVRLAPETISRLETGAEVPSVGTVEVLADGLGLDLHELFRVQPGGTPRDRAIDKLVWLLARQTASDIDALTDIAARVFALVRRRTAT